MNRKAGAKASSPEKPPVPWRRSTLAFALYSAVLMFASFPLSLAPLSWVARALSLQAPTFLTSIHIHLWPLAWIAPVFWLWLIREKQLHGRRPYLALWGAGVVYNLLVFHFLVLPHWSGVFGWLALTTYLGVYLPAFVAISRAAVHRLRVPLIVAAPVVWTALELLRGYAFTGISAALLGHTQMHWTSLIQIADAFGAYGVSFLVMFAAACVVDTLPSLQRKWRWWPAPLAACLVIAALAYGTFRLHQTPPSQGSARVALVQGTVETVFDTTAEEAYARMERAFDQHRDLTTRLLAENDGVELVIWPESMFTATDVVEERTAGEEFADTAYFDSQRQTARYAQGADPYDDRPAPARLLAGTHTIRYTDDATLRHNTALLFDRRGVPAMRYYKSHLVLFGEYLPLGDYLPWLYQFSPIGSGLAPGEAPQSFLVGGLRFAPTICFESLVPHYVQRQVTLLSREDASPDVLVNITNDGWFHGSSGLDQHLASNVFRAVENRRPMLVAANEGVSAHIDGSGRIVSTLPRQKAGVIIADVKPDGRDGLYQQVGDLPAWGLLALTALAAVAGVWLRRRET
ncbi:MAG: apolipoprotein N-acyltransferase [Pirellulaceae bacterium]